MKLLIKKIYEFLLRKINKWKWARENPKKLYQYVMIFFGLLLVLNITLDFFVSKEKKQKDFLPMLYTKSDEAINQYTNKEKRLESIVEELKGLQIKREAGTLSSGDSLRVEFLYHQYQSLKNEKEN